ncbi:MAG: Flp pilus assembly complex ATPase component TadA, partial [Clostridia bacterium]|nr:Flp pilus assembly complex ATPase component TadA [Clostridia bacterium]
NLQNGHTCIPLDKLRTLSSGLLEIEDDRIASIIEYMVSSNRLFLTEIEGKEFAYLPHMYRAESYCARRVNELANTAFRSSLNVEKEISKIEKSLKIEFQTRQKEAISNALTRGIMVLTGGPGTGKTTTLNGIIRIFEKLDFNICLAAPTGRAAKRMSEVTGREAKTLHRLLEVEWGPNHRPVFMRNERNPLDCNIIIVDELSMVDITLFESLLSAMPRGCRLVMVGDSDQLPSVGAGNVLQDVIESGIVPVVELTEIFRQALESTIITNAHLIVKGEEPDLSHKDTDFFYLNRNDAVLGADTVADLFCRRLPEAYDFLSNGDIQVLCPSRKREMGTVNINNLIQQRVNPPAINKREMKQHGFILREGDRVMQIKNNYDIMWEKDDGTDGTGVFNGDVGVLKMVDIKSDRIVVRYDDRDAYYTYEDAEQLELAYAVTVHKSQGSEFDCVILPVLDLPPQLRYRNLLYTAVTRAKKLLILVGSQEIVNQMVHNDKRTRRYTGLKMMIAENRNDL